MARQIKKGLSSLNQVLSNWSALDGRKKMIFLLASLAAVMAMIGVARLANKPDMDLLYAGLDAATAGEVIASLEQQAILFEVRGNAIYVPSAMRDQTRLTLAGQGLPANGGVGYELLDQMSGFGTTSQMFDAAYWRAKEGELARTILASRDVRSARVHISNPVNQPFARDTGASASVTVTMARGVLDEKHAEAIRFMVASAVAGLSATEVSVIDSDAGIILAAGAESSTASGNNAPEARAEAMKTNIERLLAARVGPGKAVVELTIDADMESQTITERVVDPTSRVTVSSDNEERSENATGTDAGGVTVASNLPDGDAEAGGDSSTRAMSQTRERLNFEVSETRRERVIQPGQIRRISVAVMVDGITETAADGTRSWSPRTDDELTALRALVESAIGFDPARGDVVTLQTLQFPDTVGAGTLVSDSGTSFLTGDIMRLIQTAVLGLVALAIGLFVIRPILTQQPAPVEALPVPENDGELIEGSAESVPTIPGVESDGVSDADRNKIANLRGVISERTEESADVLRRWIDAPDPATGGT